MIKYLFNQGIEVRVPLLDLKIVKFYEINEYKKFSILLKVKVWLKNF